MVLFNIHTTIFIGYWAAASNARTWLVYRRLHISKYIPMGISALKGSILAVLGQLLNILLQNINLEFFCSDLPLIRFGIYTYISARSSYRRTIQYKNT